MIHERSKNISAVAKNVDERLDVIERNGKHIDRSTMQIEEIASVTAETIETVCGLASQQEVKMSVLVSQADQMKRLSLELDQIANTFLL